MTLREEAEKVHRNLKGDHSQIAHYLVERCGEFIYDREREALITEFLRAAAQEKITRVAAGMVTGSEAAHIGRSGGESTGIPTSPTSGTVPSVDQADADGSEPSDSLSHLRHRAAFCRQVARDGILPSLAWFSETADDIDGILGHAYAAVRLPDGEGRAHPDMRNALYGLWQAIITRPSLSFVDPPLHAAIERACDALGITSGDSPKSAGGGAVPPRETP